jgi:hypothetical protein
MVTGNRRWKAAATTRHETDRALSFHHLAPQGRRGGEGAETPHDSLSQGLSTRRITWQVAAQEKGRTFFPALFSDVAGGAKQAGLPSAADGCALHPAC